MTYHLVLRSPFPRGISVSSGVSDGEKGLDLQEQQSEMIQENGQKDIEEGCGMREVTVVRIWWFYWN